MTNPEKITDFVVRVPVNGSSTQSYIDLRLMTEYQLRALCRSVVDIATPDTPWTVELAAMDYIISGRYAADQAADEQAKAAQVSEIEALLTSGNAVVAPELSTSTSVPVTDTEYHGEYDAAKKRIAELEAQLEKAGAEILDRKTAVTTRDTWLAEARRQLEAFKEEVVTVAGNYAQRHDWCEVVDRALAELGLERPEVAVEYRASVTITFDIIAKRTGDRSLPVADWVRGSVRNWDEIESAINDLEMDGDHDEDVTETRNFRYVVNDVEAI